MILRYDQGMNTPHETPAPTDPTDLAREVLDDERAWAALDPGHHPESQAAVYRLANAAPDLARAVIDMTATIKRVEALADDMDHDADLLDQTDDLRLHLIAATHREDATRLRTALNGDDQ